MLGERVSSFWLRIRALAHRRRLDRDLDDELAFHLAMRAEKLGSGTEAEAKANRQFGNATRVRETCRELWTFAPLEALWQDLRYACRTLKHAPAFTGVALLSLALGIGANTALFSLVNVMLLRALPVKDPQGLVEFVSASPGGALVTNLPDPVFDFFRQDHNVLAGVFAIREAHPALRDGGQLNRVTAHQVSGSFFGSLGVQPLLGRAIFPEDDKTGAANRVAVLSYALWSRRFGRSPSVIGANLRLFGELFTVIGVMPEEFFGVDRSRVPDLWVPLAVDPNPGEVWVLGRLQPGVSLGRARALLEPVFHRALERIWEVENMQRWPEQESRRFMSQRLVVNRATEGTSGVRWSYWEYSNTLKILVGLTALILLIACVNLANLLTARSAARAREISIRLALGAGRWRLVRQLLTENLLLAFVGGALGLLLAGWGHRILLGFLLNDPLSGAFNYRLDPRVLGFGLALSLATGLLFGLLPAIRATRTGSAGPLHGAGRQSVAAQLPLGKGLIVLQVGLSTVLLIGAGLFARSLKNLGTADLGFSRESLLLSDVQSSAKTPQARRKFWTEVTQRLSALRGVRSVALAGDAVFGNGGWNNSVWIRHGGRATQNVHLSENYVSPGFFATAGIPVLAGREFSERDRESTPDVTVVNLAFARRFFPGENPIGQRLSGGGQLKAPTEEIVGVVGDAKYGSVREELQPMFFHPLEQGAPLASCVLHLRAASNPVSLEPAIRREIEAIDGDVIVGEMKTVPQIVHTQLREDRMLATLASFFSLLALALGAIGIYGIVAYRVARRTAEIGIRMALGARQSAVLWLTLRETLILLALGVAIGVPTALAGARLVRSQLFALSPSDPLTIGCAAAAVLAAGALAAFLPARRAVSAEPMLALQSE
jgi:predicted permease